ncbi:3-oxoacyl-ACP synthase III family protein [Sphingomonas phyllosphaerae]|uniref:3-oxoacyl-ACP synthase III family protein n=1 Tax=Sphingomonas phyllosphaerae TaxID=257003 RepID=UPI000491A634|nr:ketoacyl-ACP synthase III [Sphingomonas phyllosphaerae]
MHNLPELATGRAAVVGNASIKGVVACVPPHRVGNDVFVERFGESVAEVTKMTGVAHRHWVDANTTTSDLCAEAATRLMAGLDWSTDSIDAILFISQTPDYRLPATAAVLQARLELRPGIIAFDVNLGCSAYPYGLWLAMTMVATGAARRVLLAVGDTSSRVVDPSDRSTALLFGDAGSVTAIEYDPLAPVASFVLGSDGRGAQNLIIPQGAFRDGAARGDHDQTRLFMDGGEIFTFTLKAVPPLVADTFRLAEASADDYDAFLFHQANAFMIKHLAKKSKLPTDKVPINIDRYGNTSSATIPLLIADDLSERLRSSTMRLAMFGFGVGYSWASASITIGRLACVETITS